MSHTESGA
ncbi:hypothetical protein VCHC17A1_3977A, partial [Vibrio cholerae HC-17A1]